MLVGILKSSTCLLHLLQLIVSFAFILQLFTWGSKNTGWMIHWQSQNSLREMVLCHLLMYEWVTFGSVVAGPERQPIELRNVPDFSFLHCRAVTRKGLKRLQCFHQLNVLKFECLFRYWPENLSRSPVNTGFLYNVPCPSFLVRIMINKTFHYTSFSSSFQMYSEVGRSLTGGVFVNSKQF